MRRCAAFVLCSAAAATAVAAGCRGEHEVVFVAVGEATDAGADAGADAQIAASFCSPSTCEGCCSPDGVCRIGLADDSCGAGGLACQSCAASGARCEHGTCVAPDGGDGMPLSCEAA